jgi:hypothetical protein
VFSKKKELSVTVMLLWDRKKIKPNFGLPGELITRLVTSNFWELLTLHTIKSVSWSQVSTTHVVHPVYPLC